MDDLDYIAERVSPETTLCFADDNFGMYERDIEIADYISHLQKRYGWPQYIRTTTGKNRSDRIIQVMRKVGGVLPMTAAVQSLNDEVMRNIKRSNIKLSAYADIQEEVRRQGMQSYGELILCLPGETKATFMKGVEDLLDAGVSRVSAHQLMLINGAPLANPESREQHGLVSKFRIVARNLGHYATGHVFELEEVVIETQTFSYKEYLEARVFHLLLTIFFYENNFEEAFRLAGSYGLKPYDLVVRLSEALDRAPLRFQQLIDDFIEESETELFEDPDDCLAWAEENFDALISGDLGGNLLSKFSMMGRFHYTREALEFLETILRDVLPDNRSDSLAEEISAVAEYLRSVSLFAPFRESLRKNPDWATHFDVEAWRLGGFEQELARYRLPQLETFATEVPEERRRLIESKIDAFGENPSQLGKFTRTMFAHDLRRVIRPAEDGPI
jgi:hypothetical protein